MLVLPFFAGTSRSRTLFKKNAIIYVQGKIKLGNCRKRSSRFLSTNAVLGKVVEKQRSSIKVDLTMQLKQFGNRIEVGLTIKLRRSVS